MRKFEAVRNQEDRIIKALERTVITSDRCKTEAVPVVYGGVDTLDTYALAQSVDAFYTQIADRVEDMMLPVMGVTKTEVGAVSEMSGEPVGLYVKMRGLFYTSGHDQMNEILEQLLTVNKDPKVTVGPIKIGRRKINGCLVLMGEFDITGRD